MNLFVVPIYYTRATLKIGKLLGPPRNPLPPSLTMHNGPWIGASFFCPRFQMSREFSAAAMRTTQQMKKAYRNLRHDRPLNVLPVGLEPTTL
jgi:hypothetical protein